MQARSDAEADAIRCGYIQSGGACCTNCGKHYPPEDAAKEGKLVWCTHWDIHAAVSYFCKAWRHEKRYHAGVAPAWCKPYTKERR